MREHSALRDTAVVAVGFLLSLAVGLASNRLRPDPLPVPYVNATDRPSDEAGQPGAVTLAGAEAAWRAGETLFVDAREPDFYEDGHIPGAVNLPASRASQAGALPGDPDRPVIVYCTGADCRDSRTVALALCAAGRRNVDVFAGGWDEWTQAGLPQ
jgi:rhodanese-related sulfurtransferase